jgi:UTP-glucose-1-phosphate uridylyltransferase
VLGPPIFDVLEKLSRDKGGELQLTPAIAKLLRDGKRVLAKPLPNNLQRHDTGNFEGYFKALKEYLE